MNVYCVMTNHIGDQAGYVSKPQNHKLITVASYSSVLSHVWLASSSWGVFPVITDFWVWQYCTCKLDQGSDFATFLDFRPKQEISVVMIYLLNDQTLIRVPKGFGAPGHNKQGSRQGSNLKSRFPGLNIRVASSETKRLQAPRQKF